MALLLYCVAAAANVPESLRGVNGTSVLHYADGEIATLYSSVENTAAVTGPDLHTSISDFHGVLKRTFEKGAIIPFRFPTLLQNEQELRTHTSENSGRYASLLQRFADFAQMEASFAATSKEGAPARAQSGADYLRGRQANEQNLRSAAARIQGFAGPLVSTWKLRPMRRGARLFGLVRRSSVREFVERMRSFAVPAGLEVRITGPWPVTEFLELEGK